MGWTIKLFGIVVKIIKIMSVRLLVSRLGDRSVSWLVTISSKGRKASHPMPLSENFHMFHRDARNAVISIFFTSTKKTGKKANKTPDLVFRYKKKKIFIIPYYLVRIQYLPLYLFSGKRAPTCPGIF